MGKPSGDDTATHYLSAHARVVALVGGLDSEQLATPVSGTPEWSVHDVIAHLAAVTTDAMAGRLTGMPTDEFTAGQVADRRDRTAQELLDEWAPNVGPMADGARAGLVPPNLAVDVLTHEQDIRGALGLPPALNPAELRFCVNLYSFGCGHQVKRSGLPAVRLTCSDTDFDAIAGEGEPAASVTAPEFELFRALSGRRSRAQVSGYDWSGDVASYADVLNVFGRLPEADVVDVGQQLSV